MLVSCGKKKDTVTAVSKGRKGIDFKCQSTFNLSLGGDTNFGMHPNFYFNSLTY